MLDTIRDQIEMLRTTIETDGCTAEQSSTLGQQIRRLEEALCALKYTTIVKARSAGVPNCQVAADFGVTCSWISQITHAASLSLPIIKRARLRRS